MKRVSALMPIALFLSSFVIAQAQQSMPAPPPEIQLMAYFIGNWTTQGTMKTSPTGPGAPFTSTERSEWTAGNYFVETHSSMNSPMGDIQGTRVMEYNAADKVYTYNAYNSLGEHIVAIGHVQGNTWTWTADQKMNGLVTKARYTVNVVSPTAYSFKSEVATPSGGWASVMEGKATRAQ